MSLPTTPETARAAEAVLALAREGMTDKQATIAIRYFLGVDLTREQLRWIRRNGGIRRATPKQFFGSPSPEPEPTNGLRWWLGQEDIA